MISHKINHNGVGVVRGQWHIASKNWLKLTLPPLLGENEGISFTLAMFYLWIPAKFTFQTPSEDLFFTAVTFAR